MKLRSLYKKLFEKYLKFDDAFDIEDIIDHINESVIDILSLLIKYKSGYNLSTQGFALSQSTEQTQSLPEKYLLPAAVKYFEKGEEFEINIYSMFDSIPNNIETCRILKDKIIFYNIKNSKSITLYYTEKFEEINSEDIFDSENKIKIEIEINIPQYAENLLCFTVLRKCKLQNQEDKKNIDNEYIYYEFELKKTLEKLQSKGSHNYRTMQNYY